MGDRYRKYGRWEKILINCIFDKQLGRRIYLKNS